MAVAWRGAVFYALVVTLGSWAAGALVGLSWSVAVWDGFGFWVSWWITNSMAHVSLAVTVMALTLVRRFAAPGPVWRVSLIDGGVYLLVLLLSAGLSAWWVGSEAPADDAFAVAIFALLTLQLPAAWLLVFSRARRLGAVSGRAAGG
ncbi:hypothetical protein GCM10010232_35290 [Streptomyces amakusaensis]|uniref:Integral membrane protein n=1 Tax=Streptomyces amakusaensis TaxID=67271 RepID=A0ABW0AIZ8_9ACTN